MRTTCPLLLVLICSPAFAQHPVGGEFQVNTYTVDHQLDPRVALDGGGGFVVVWQSNGSSGTDSDFFSIQAQRYVEGLPAGDEFQVNTYTTEGQFWPAVGSDGAGGFVVVWASDGSYGNDSSDLSVQARRYAADGTPAGDQFQVNSYITSWQNKPTVGPNGDGGFVVAWESYWSDATGPDTWSVQAQLFAADGSPVGGQFQVSSSDPWLQYRPRVALDGAGGFVVAWESYVSTGSDTDRRSIQARRYAADGTPAGGEFQVNTYTTHVQYEPAVAPLGASGFVIVWSSIGSPADDSSEFSIQGQRFAADGTPAGDQFQVNTYTTGAQFSPAVGPDGDGGFVVTWNSAGSHGSDSSSYSIQARRYAADGSPASEEWQVNSYTTSAQNRPEASLDGAGGFVVTWHSTGSSGTDSSGIGIQAQRFAVTIFEDGFESGDTSAWSATVP